MGLRPSFGVIFTVMLSVAIFLARGYRGSFAARGARNRGRSRAGAAVGCSQWRGRDGRFPAWRDPRRRKPLSGGAGERWRRQRREVENVVEQEFRDFLRCGCGSLGAASLLSRSVGLAIDADVRASALGTFV